MAGGQLPVEPNKISTIIAGVYPLTSQVFAHHLHVVHLLGIVEGNDQIAISRMRSKFLLPPMQSLPSAEEEMIKGIRDSVDAWGIGRYNCRGPGMSGNPKNTPLQLRTRPYQKIMQSISLVAVRTSAA